MKQYVMIAGIVALSGCSGGLSILGIGGADEDFEFVRCADGTDAEDSRMIGRSTIEMRCGPQVPSPSEPPLQNEEDEGLFDVFTNSSSAENARATSISGTTAATGIQGVGQRLTGSSRNTLEPFNLGVAAFRDICMANAPTFAGSVAAATAYGITTTNNLGFLVTGINPETQVNIQVEPGEQCSVVTPSRTTNAIVAQFATLVGKTIPGRKTIAGSDFLFTHDRNGREAYTMDKQ